jgi:hypothetical protein
MTYPYGQYRPITMETNMRNWFPGIFAAALCFIVHSGAEAAPTVQPAPVTSSHSMIQEARWIVHCHWRHHRHHHRVCHRVWVP